MKILQTQKENIAVLCAHFYSSITRFPMQTLKSQKHMFVQGCQMFSLMQLNGNGKKTYIFMLQLIDLKLITALNLIEKQSTIKHQTKLFTTSSCNCCTLWPTGASFLKRCCSIFNTLIFNIPWIISDNFYFWEFFHGWGFSLNSCFQVFLVAAASGCTDLPQLWVSGRV